MSNYDHFTAPHLTKVHALHGAQPAAPHITRQGMGEGISRARDSRAPYVGRGSKCMGNDDTCGANRVKDEVLCAGHLRSVKKAAAE